MFQRYSSMRSPDDPEFKKEKPRRPRPKPTRLWRVLCICFLPLWLGSVAAFDRAVTEYKSQVFTKTVLVGMTKISQEQDQKQAQKVKRTFYVDPDKDGNVSGQISPIDSRLKVALVKNGAEVVTDRTDGGRFTLEDVPTGALGETYCFIASGPNGFLAYSIHVRALATEFTQKKGIQPKNHISYVSLPGSVNPSFQVQETVPEEPSDELSGESEQSDETQLDPTQDDVEDNPIDEKNDPLDGLTEEETDLPIDDFSEENSLEPAMDELGDDEENLQDEAAIVPQDDAPDAVNANPDVAPKDMQIRAAAIPPSFRELSRIIQGHVPPDTQLSNTEAKDGARPTDADLEFDGSFEYFLDEDGHFSGRVLLPSGDADDRNLSDLNVFLIQDDKEKAQAVVSKNGDFTFRYIETGVYGFVAAGVDGFAALSVKLVSPNDKSVMELGAATEATEHYVSIPKKREAPPFRITIITDPEDLKYVRKTVQKINRDGGAGFRNPIGQDPGRTYQSAAASGGGEFGAVLGPGPGPLAPATRSFAPGPATQGFAPRILGRRRLLRAAVIGSIIAISVDGPPPMSPATPSS